jgi:2-C-methyl-D-erythritol 4-phosphate cytidylyltransferase
MGQEIPKQFIAIQGKPIFVYTLEKLDSCSAVDDVVLVVSSDYENAIKRTITEWSIRKVSRVVVGGKERQDSVGRGLENLTDDVGIVAIHDSVRPFVSVEKIRDVIESARERGAAILAIPVKDTVKKADDGWVEETLDREQLWAVQTPQAFRREWIEAGYEKAKQEGFVGTDDAMLVERLGHKVYIVDGEEKNIKITSPEDLLWAEQIVKGGEW